MEFLTGSPLLMGGVVGIVITLIGVIWILRSRKSPGLKVADDFIKGEVDDAQNEAAKHKANADNALNNGITGDDISVSDAERIIARSISNGAGGDSS